MSGGNKTTTIQQQQQVRERWTFIDSEQSLEDNSIEGQHQPESTTRELVATSLDHRADLFNSPLQAASNSLSNAAKDQDQDREDGQDYEYTGTTNDDNERGEVYEEGEDGIETGDEFEVGHNNNGERQQNLLETLFQFPMPQSSNNLAQVDYNNWPTSTSCIEQPEQVAIEQRPQERACVNYMGEEAHCVQSQQHQIKHLEQMTLVQPQQTKDPTTTTTNNQWLSNKSSSSFAGSALSLCSLSRSSSSPSSSSSSSFSTSSFDQKLFVPLRTLCHNTNEATSIDKASTSSTSVHDTCELMFAKSPHKVRDHHDTAEAALPAPSAARRPHQEGKFCLGA